MRSGGFDRLATFTRPGSFARSGRSRVEATAEEIAADVPCSIEFGSGKEGFGNAEDAASGTWIFRIRREPDVEALDAGCRAVDDEGHVYDIKAVGPAERPGRSVQTASRDEIEVHAVRAG